MNIRQFTAEMARQNQEALKSEEEQLDSILERVQEFTVTSSSPNHFTLSASLTDRQVEALREMGFEVQTEETVAISW